MTRRHAHRPDTLRDDLRALLWLLVFAAGFIAVCSVDFR